MEKEDKQLICVDCKREFCWTVKEAEKIEDLYLQGEIESITVPKRCFDCRQAKKIRYAAKLNPGMT